MATWSCARACISCHGPPRVAQWPGGHPLAGLGVSPPRTHRTLEIEIPTLVLQGSGGEGLTPYPRRGFRDFGVLAPPDHPSGHLLPRRPTAELEARAGTVGIVGVSSTCQHRPRLEKVQCSIYRAHLPELGQNRSVGGNLTRSDVTTENVRSGGALKRAAASLARGLSGTVALPR